MRKMAYYLPKTSDFLRQNIRTFYAKPPYFYLEKSEVFVFSAEKTQKSRGKRAEKPMVRILQYSGLMKEVVAFEGILGAITVAIYIYKTTRKHSSEKLHTTRRRNGPSGALTTKTWGHAPRTAGQTPATHWQANAHRKESGNCHQTVPAYRKRVQLAGTGDFRHDFP